MTKIKLCGLSRECDIDAVNKLQPEFIGFVFWKKSKRYITPEKALLLKNRLSKDIISAGVFIDEELEVVAGLLNDGIIDIAQLHGKEDENYINRLRELTGKKIIKAFIIKSEDDIKAAEDSIADYVLLDSGAGTGKAFDRTLLKNIKRPYFLAGGLYPDTVGEAIRELHPFAVDVSSGIETDGLKDETKMTAFVNAVRKEE